MGGLYLVGAYEIHKRVNRSSDGIGANSPYYGYLVGQGPNGPNAAMLDWADYEAYAAEYPDAAPAGSPAYSTAYDVADEWAMKFGGQYTFDFGLTVSALYEDLHREFPPVMEFQNERQRHGDWLALQQASERRSGRRRGRLGACQATRRETRAASTTTTRTASATIRPTCTPSQYWHKLDKQLTMYFDVAETINDGNAHYDIGAGGHGIKTDCHDATHDAVHRLQQRGSDHLGRLPPARHLDRGELYVLSARVWQATHGDWHALDGATPGGNAGSGRLSDCASARALCAHRRGNAARNRGHGGQAVGCGDDGESDCRACSRIPTSSAIMSR